MPQETNKDIVYIREWIAKEPYLPQDLDDEILAKFLHSCYWSLEKTKKCINRFCTTRSVMSDIYNTRDPLLPNLQSALSVSVVASYEWEKKEILIHKFIDPTMDKYIFNDFLKSHTIQTDYWIKDWPQFAEGHYLILDMACYTLKMIPKTNFVLLRDYIVFMLEGMPIRVKKILVINAPSFVDKIYSFIKPALPTDICDIIHFFPDHESVYKIIDKKYLPTEYGGEAQSIHEQYKKWRKDINDSRKIFLNDSMWKADLAKKPKDSITPNEMNGSFRTLSID